MRQLNLRVFAMARPAALPQPARLGVQAFTRANVSERWATDAAGVRALESGDNVITMFETIGEDFWSGGGVTAKKVASQLRAIGDRPVEVQINSRGGDMFEGITVHNPALNQQLQHLRPLRGSFLCSTAGVILSQ